MRPKLETRRQVFAQILVCLGCCCGRTQKGHPPVPVEWLKAEFKARKLIRNVQVTISGCLGPCDVANVVAIATPGGGLRWYGRLAEFWQYESLVEWATEVKRAQALLPLPQWMEGYEIDPFESASQSGVAGADFAELLEERRGGLEG